MKRIIVQIVSAFIIGAIIGASAMNLYISREFEELTVNNHMLQEELESTKSDLEEARNHLKKQQQNKIITDIEANVEIDQDLSDIPSFEAASIQLAGKKRIKELLQPLIEQEIKTINYNLIPPIIDGREFSTDGKRYILNVDMIIITDELQIFATAKTLKEE